MNHRLVQILLTALMVSATAASAGRAVDAEDKPPAAPPTEFDCRFAAGPIAIDAKADEPAWQAAEVINQFSLPWLQDKARPARTTTKARMLWDRENLYFFAEMQDADLYADIKEHDGETWYNDVFELFFQPAADKPGYYEFQVNAAGTVMDMFIPRRGAGGFRRFINDGEFHIEAKIVQRGTLNKWSDTDEGWSVEGRIPWRDFVRTGGRPSVGELWKFALCRYDYSVDFEGPELSTCAPLNSQRYPDFHHHEDYAAVRFVGPETVGTPSANRPADPPGADAARPAPGAPSVLEILKQSLLTVPSRVVGSPDPPPPYRVQRVLPALKLSWPIAVVIEPGSRRLWLIDQKWSYGPARLIRTTVAPEAGELETLLEFPAGGVAYSLCFHPRFDENGFVYVGWNGTPGGGDKRTIITRYTVEREAPQHFDAKSALDVIEWKSDGHNGAAVAFGNDGMFYVTSGDGTSDSDTNVTGQGLDHLLAKVLRIDVDHPSEGRAYSIPPDNPFVGVEGARPETWAYGFRNPWRMTVDPKTGDVWVGNNGQDLWEQAYLIQRGANYGWSVYEGSHVFYANRKLGPTPHVKPTLEHPHSESRSLTGGVVYYGDRLPDLQGAYIYGDHSTGKIWGAKVRSGQVVWHKELTDTTLQITGFAVDHEGELLILDHRGNQEGGCYSLVPNAAAADSPREPTTPQTATPPNGAFPRTLSESGLFASVAGHQVHPGLIPYDVNAPLWSDGASKARYLFLPPATGSADSPQPSRIDFTTNKNWDFPDHTVAVKSFALETEEGRAESRRWVETRFLTKQQGEWAGYSYLWNDEQTEATLVGNAGADRTFQIRSADGTIREQTWRFPSRAECMVCHSRAAKFVLGLSALQLNRPFDYGDVTANQLEILEWLGLLRVNWSAELNAALREEFKTAGLSDSEIDRRIPEITATRGQRGAPTSSLLFQSPQHYEHLVDPYDQHADLTARARSYLHANCAQCHVEAGGGNAQMQLEFITPLEKTNILDVTPLHHTFEITDARLIAPGAPQRSVLLHRIATRDRGQMPQLATSLIDPLAVELLRTWIASLKPTP